MARKNINDEPFDESTLAKLDLYEDYAEAWIPTFVMSGHKHICIFDFFAGSGYDSTRVPGSPIRLLMQIRKFIGHIFQKGTEVTLHLNEFEKRKFLELRQSCNSYLAEYPEVGRAIKIEYYNEDFAAIFEQLLPVISKYPSLVYLDQYGVKFLADKYVLALEQTNMTDFLYFVSSSHFLRFGKTDEFRKHFTFDVDSAKREPYKFIHRNLLKQLKEILPKSTGLKLYPFSLLKGNNIHGVVFGAKSIRAIDKFLEIAWKRAPINGDANFDIDDDAQRVQLDLFSGKRLSKIEVFNNALQEYVKKNKIVTNKEVFYFTLEAGHPRQHAANKLRELKKSKLIDYKGLSPKIEYKYIKSDNDIVQIKWI